MSEKATLIAILLLILVQVSVVLIAFNQNLPTWCANPTVGYNYIVQPICN